MASVPSATVCVPRWLLKSVPVKPGSADAVERPGAAGHVDDARMFDCAQQRQERVHHPYRTEDVDRDAVLDQPPDVTQASQRPPRADEFAVDVGAVAGYDVAEMLRVSERKGGKVE